MKIKLERVLGVTAASNAALDSDSNSETVVYPAGCTAVLFNTHTGVQNHIINTSRKTITSVSFSSCGRYLVTGECGHQPTVRVWDLQSEPQLSHPGLPPQIQQVAEFQSHKFGINCVAFSPNNKYVVSIGTQHDMIVNVWDWKTGVKVASNKVSTKVKALAFAENGSYFVTVGNRHVKFWYLDCGKNKYHEAVPLTGRSAILGDQRNNYFCDVACGKGECGDSTYVITRSGLLCEFNNRRLLDKWVELRTSSANCIVVGEQYIFVGCADGIVRCFDPTTLTFITTLPRTHYLGVDVSQGLTIQHMSTPPPNSKYPDAVAITFDEVSKKLTCIYNDHSIYVWDVHNIRRVGKSHSFLYHSACIWGVEMAPQDSPLPSGSFLTCSSDDTIRVWTLDKVEKSSFQSDMYKKNVYSNELLKVVYIDKDMTHLKDLNISFSTVGQDKPETSYDGRNGVRCLRLSPDGENLASGDRSGNIRIHETRAMKEMLKIEAHDAEVLCLEYTSPESDHRLMASASRDRLIHVFDVNKDYNFLQTLDDHSSSITAVRFLNTQHGNLQMVSSSADKSLIFRSLGGTPNGTPQFNRDHNASGKTTLFDMEVDVAQKHVITACQDRNIRIFSVGTGKHSKSFKGTSGDDGSLIKVVLDRSGIYLATSSTDKSLSVFDYYTGECMATMCGHSELATGLRFTNDCRRLISASGDGCIFVWRVPHDMVVTMHARLNQQALRRGKTVDSELFADRSNVDFYTSNTASPDSHYRFSVGPLPLWAKKQMADDATAPLPVSKVAAPKGRWAQRAEKNLTPKSFYSESTTISSSASEEKTSESEVSFFSNRLVETAIPNRSEDDDFALCEDSFNEIMSRTPPSAVSSPKNMALRGNVVRDIDLESSAHDGDIDSDQEYRHQLYYPTQVDSASGSEFTVTNMDADELRKSMRKSKKSTNFQQIQPMSISGSQDSEDDDDEASTPSGENTDRNPMSMLSVSSESLDQIVSREKYLQSTFESMSGAEMDQPSGNKKSISAQFHTRMNGTPLRNLEIIKAAKQTKNDVEASKKREELKKRIEETKKKLDNVGYASPLKYSQSTHDLTRIPVKEKWSAQKQGNPTNAPSTAATNTCLTCHRGRSATNPAPQPPGTLMYQDNTSSTNHYLPGSVSLPSDLQLCGCYMKDIAKNTLELNHFLYPNNAQQQQLNALARPRKLKLDKTLAKYKHKSLPVSPVSEERQLSDFVRQEGARKSFSYYLEMEKTEDGLKRVCQDIEHFFGRGQVPNISLTTPEAPERDQPEAEHEDEGSFSSDSLEDLSFGSTRRKPRRCVSSNEIYKYQQREATHPNRSASFYLNPSGRNSQESLGQFSDEDEFLRAKHDSMESVLSNESDCKSAPLEALFGRKPSEYEYEYSKSLPKTHVYSDFSAALTAVDAEKSEIRRSKSLYCYCSSAQGERVLKCAQTQTDFEVENEKRVSKRSNNNTSADFQQKLLKFEQMQQQTKAKTRSVAFFVEANNKAKSCSMYIPSLETKNEQYRRKFCNVLNNKPDANGENLCESRSHFALTNVNVNFSKNTNTNTNTNTHTNTNTNNNRKSKKNFRETSSLDRHLLFAKSLALGQEKIVHKPPKGARRNNSARMARKSKTVTTTTTYEYIKKDEFYLKNTNQQLAQQNSLLKLSNKERNNENKAPSNAERSFEFGFNEKSFDKDCDSANTNNKNNLCFYDSLETSGKQLGSARRELELELELELERDSLDPSAFAERKDEDKIFDSLEYDLWRKSDDSNNDVQFAVENVKILNEIQRKIQRINNLVEVIKENMFAGKVRTLSSLYENMQVECVSKPACARIRRRNLSLPNFVERRLTCAEDKIVAKKKPEEKDLLKECTSKVKEKDRPSSVRLDESLNSSLRRACSLSDLTVQQTPQQKSKIEQQVPDKSSKKAQAPVLRHASSRKSHSSTIMRSSSIGVLNQTDSETEGSDRKFKRLMKPTISSQNKVANNAGKNVPIRKRYSHSVMNLSSVGQEDSSSEEADKPKKPAVPPRKSTLAKANNVQPEAMPRRPHVSLKDKALNKEVYSSNSEEFDTTLCADEEISDVSSMQLSTQLCDQVVLQLTNAAENVVALYRRLTEVGPNSSEDLASVQKTDMVKNLEMSIARTQRMLQDLILEKMKHHFNVNQTDAVKKLNDLVSKGFAKDQNAVVVVMQLYSDILLEILQQNFQSNNI